ncbi:hypothetical protein ACA910_001051 [Epithemia clementina (nom. ined.)]
MEKRQLLAAPALAISPRDGRLVRALGTAVWSGPAADKDENDPDISWTMKRRATNSMYSMDAFSNMKLFVQEVVEEQIVLAAVASIAKPLSSTQPHQTSLKNKMNRMRLLRLWSWIERVESLCRRSSSGETIEDPLLSAVSSSMIGAQQNNNNNNTSNKRWTWQAKGLVDSGTLRLLKGATAGGPPPPPSQQPQPQHSTGEEELLCDLLGCSVYDSPGRRAALAAFGWTTSATTRNIMEPQRKQVSIECEECNELERAALIAVWHSEMEAAAAVIASMAESIRAMMTADQVDEQENYAAFLDQVSSAVATFSRENEEWHHTCTDLIQTHQDLIRDRSRFVHRSGIQTSFLSALLSFLATSNNPEKRRDQVLLNQDLSLSDRVAFACRFLPLDKLQGYLQRSVMESQTQGNIEGLVLTGIDRYGIRILQSFVDQTADVQTAALVTCRVILPVTWVPERKIVTEWLEVYRTLLNTLQLWHTRALLDIDRAKLVRQDKAKKQSKGPEFVGSIGAVSGNGIGIGGPPGGAIAASRLRLRTSPINPTKGKPMHAYPHHPNPQQQQQQLLHHQPGGGVARMTSERKPDPGGNNSSAVESLHPPLQLDARCNFCSKPLLLKYTKDGAVIEKLSKMKPVLACCPNCRKPLPRCAVCMLPMGVVNPYLDLIRRMSSSTSSSLTLPSSSTTGPAAAAATKNKEGVGGDVDDDMTNTKSLPLAEWFTWCRRCKHGGHAHHISGWFANRSVCPVSGCECQCQKLDQNSVPSMIIGLPSVLSSSSLPRSAVSSIPQEHQQQQLPIMHPQIK